MIGAEELDMTDVNCGGLPKRPVETLTPNWQSYAGVGLPPDRDAKPINGLKNAIGHEPAGSCNSTDSTGAASGAERVIATENVSRTSALCGGTPRNTAIAAIPSAAMCSGNEPMTSASTYISIGFWHDSIYAAIASESTTICC